jgi:hypothetical protein
VRCVPRRREPFLRVGHKTQNRHTQTANFTGTVLMKNLNRRLLLPVRTTGIPFDRFNNTGESRDHTRDTRDTRITLVTGIPYGMRVPYYFMFFVQRKHRYSQHRNHPPPRFPPLKSAPANLDTMYVCLSRWRGRQPIGARAA